MTFLAAMFAALTPWAQAFFQALLPFLKTQVQTPVQRTAAEADPAIQQQVQDAIDAYDHDQETAGGTAPGRAGAD